MFFIVVVCAWISKKTKSSLFLFSLSLAVSVAAVAVAVVSVNVVVFKPHLKCFCQKRRPAKKIDFFLFHFQKNLFLSS